MDDSPASENLRLRAEVQRLNGLLALRQRESIGWRYKFANDLQWQFTTRPETIHPQALVELVFSHSAQQQRQLDAQDEIALKFAHGAESALRTLTTELQMPPQHPAVTLLAHYDSEISRLDDQDCIYPSITPAP